MEFIPFANVCKAELIYLMDGQYCENVLNYQASDTLTEPVLIEAAGRLRDQWDASMKPQTASGASLVKIKMTDLTTENGPAIEFSTGMPIAGTCPGATSPNNVTFVLKFSTGLRGRSYRGRMYWVGVGVNQLLGSKINPASLPGITTAAEDMMALNVNGVDWPLVVCSRFHNKVARIVGVATPVQNVSIDTTTDSQRRRLPGRGR